MDTLNINVSLTADEVKGMKRLRDKRDYEALNEKFEPVNTTKI